LVDIVMAAPFIVPGTESVLAGSYHRGIFFCGLDMLFVPEYLRWQLLGGNYPLEHLPLIGDKPED
jgi:hypothetical protein